MASFFGPANFDPKEKNLIFFWLKNKKFPEGGSCMDLSWKKKKN